MEACISLQSPPPTSPLPPPPSWRSGRSGCSAFFSGIDIKEQWVWANIEHTHGTGNPFLGQEVKDFLRSKKKKDLREGIKPTQAIPMYSSDHIAFEKKVHTQLSPTISLAHVHQPLLLQTISHKTDHQPHPNNQPHA